MKWKILTALDVAFSSIAVIAALVLGNSLLGEHVPKLHDNATWLSKLIMNGLIAPDALADWALGSLPGIVTLLVFALCVASESLLIAFSPLVERLAAFTAATTFSVDFSSAYQEITRSRVLVASLRRHMVRRVMFRLFGKSLLAFVIGVSAGAIAWGVAILINANTGGFIQTLAVIAAIAVLLLINAVLGEVLEEGVADDESVAILRERFTQAEM